VKFSPTKLADCTVIDVQEMSDDRGFFARAWCKNEMEEAGLSGRLCQANLSFNHEKGTLRGLHYQVEPYGEAKLVRTTKGAIVDVAVDIRPGSPTFGQWHMEELTADNHRMLYVPEGFAHAFQTLEDDTEVFYLVSEFYTPGAEQGIRYDDPRFGIDWPLPVSRISDKDASWPPFAGKESSEAS
jgi:dTDP-4-dehydrorhamnose 3,5-epimerase